MTETGARPARLPWLRLFVRDLLGSSALSELSCEQIGALILLTAHAWERTDCALPNDPTRLARLARIPEPRWTEVGAPLIEACFALRPAGLVPIEPADLQLEAARAEAQRERQATAGRASAAARGQRSGTTQPNRGSTTVAAAVRTTVEPQPEPTSSSTSTRTSSRTKRAPRPRVADATRESWLTAFGSAWTEALDGTPPWGEMAAAFAAPLGDVGTDELLSRWQRYLETTEARFVSPTKFAQRHGAFKVASAEDGPTAMERERDRLLALQSEGKL